MFWKKKTHAEVKPREKVGLNGHIWVKCEQCAANLYEKRFLENLRVCPRCRHHHRLTARERLAVTLDEGSFREADTRLAAADPLSFTAVKGYREKLDADRRRTGLVDAVLAGTGTIAGLPVEIVVMDSNFIMGSMGAVVGEKICRAAERAGEEKRPLVIFSAGGGGARMYEGMYSLMQMARTSSELGWLARRRVPFISVLTDPTMAGVAASFAFLGDVIIAEPGALVGFTGPRVIEQTIRAKLPEGFQRAEFWHRKGALDMVVARAEIKTLLARLLVLFAPGDQKKQP